MFNLSKATALHLHAIVGENEALEWGVFRSRPVRISGTDYIPPHPTELDDRFEELLNITNELKSPLARAIGVFLGCARNQFFFDCNKRMGQFLMNGILLSNGQHIVTIPARDKQAYDQHMLNYYDTGESEGISQFLTERQINLADGLEQSSTRGSIKD